MGQPYAVLERGTALVVDEKEIQAFGRMSGRERRDDRLQQLALARARGPTDQHVRPVPQQVQPGDVAARPPYGRDERAGRAVPCVGYPRRVRPPGLQHVEQGDGGGKGVGCVRSARIPDRSQRQSDLPAGVFVETLERSSMNVSTFGEGDGYLSLVRAHLHDRPALARKSLAGRRHPHHRDPRRRPLSHQASEQGPGDLRLLVDEHHRLRG